MCEEPEELDREKIKCCGLVLVSIFSVNKIIKEI